MDNINEFTGLYDGMSSLEFHLALINRATLDQDLSLDSEVRDAALWILPEIIGDDLIWWHISSHEKDELYLVAYASPWFFIIQFYKEHGFVKVLLETKNKDEPSYDHVDGVEFIDFDKNPQEYPPIKKLIESFRVCSKMVDEVAPNSRQSQLDSWKADFDGFNNDEVEDKE